MHAGCARACAIRLPDELHASAACLREIVKPGNAEWTGHDAAPDDVLA
jgi:hypothetical protein